MKEICQKLYDWLYTDMSLASAGLILGLILIIAHLYAFFQRESLSDWLRKMPRDRNVGIVILTVCLVWSYIIVSAMDLGEFHTIRKYIQMLLPVAYVLVILYVDEFLSVRASGILLLLAAAPVLDAAFLEEPTSRLLLPIMAYSWIVIGLFWVGMPYLMRDQINWVTEKATRWKAACATGAGFGVLVLACTFAFFR